MCCLSTSVSVGFIKSRVRCSMSWGRSKCSVVTTLSLWLTSAHLSSLSNVKLLLPLTQLMFSNSSHVMISTCNLAPHFQMRQISFGHILDTKGTQLVNSRLSAHRNQESQDFSGAAQELLRGPLKYCGSFDVEGTVYTISGPPVLTASCKTVHSS